MKVSQYMARQYANPTGLFGRVITSLLLNRANKDSNDAVFTDLEIQPGDRVLEVGFGGAKLLFDIARNSPCSEVSGVEKSTAMLQRAKARVQRDRALREVKLICGDIATLAFPEHSFERVCSVNTVYFWSDLQACCEQLARVTTPNGRVVLGFGSGDRLRQAGYTEHGFVFHSADEIHQATAQVGLHLIRLNRLERSNKDPFFIASYSNHAE
jgi:arsenite methyltransferase